MKRTLIGSMLAAAVLLSTAAVTMADKTAKEPGKVESSLVRVGSPAPAFSLTDQDGKTVSLSDFAGKIVVVEWFNNECPFVKKHYVKGAMNATAAKYTAKGVVWLAVNSTSGKADKDNKSVAGEWNIAHPILNDSAGSVGKAYGAKSTPQMFVIRADGTVAYKGAIDSVASADADDVSKATNYVAAALDEILAGKSVTTPETAAYGCSVKYAK